MKKFIIGLAVGALALTGFSAAASASKPGEGGIQLDRGQHLKADICHWANGHPHLVPVSISAVTTEQDAKHGDLRIDADADFVSFTAHDAPGHKTADGEDFVLRIYKKHGNTEIDTYVNVNQDCSPGEGEPEPELVTAEVCLNDVVTTFGPGLELVVDAAVDAYLDANPDAVVGDECPVEETTTTTLLEEPVVPVVPVEPVVVPVVEPAAPVAAPRTAAPVVLPHTV